MTAFLSRLPLSLKNNGLCIISKSATVNITVLNITSTQQLVLFASNTRHNHSNHKHVTKQFYLTGWLKVYILYMKAHLIYLKQLSLLLQTEYVLPMKEIKEQFLYANICISKSDKMVSGICFVHLFDVQVRRFLLTTMASGSTQLLRNEARYDNDYFTLPGIKEKLQTCMTHCILLSPSIMASKKT